MKDALNFRATQVWCLICLHFIVLYLKKVCLLLLISEGTSTCSSYNSVMEKKKFSLSFFMSSFALFFPFSFCPFAISSLPLSFQDFVLSSSHFSSWVFLSYYLSFSLCCLPVFANFLFLPVQTTVEEGFLCQLFLPL